MEQWGAEADRLEDDQQLHDLIEAIRSMLRLIENRSSYLTSRRSEDLLPRQMAAGGLARCVALLDAMCTVGVSRPDVLGVLTRSLWEAWLVSLYVLYVGSAALHRLKGAHRRSARIISEKRRLGLEDRLDGWAEQEERLEYGNLVARVDAHLRADQERAGIQSPAPLAAMGYDYLYRSESLADVHAGLVPLRRYVSFDETLPYAEVDPRPPAAHPPSRVLLLGAQHVALLAEKVFKAFSLHDEPVAEALGVVQSVLPPHPEEAEKEATRACVAEEDLQLTSSRQDLLQVLRHRLERISGSSVAARAILRSAGTRRRPAR